MFCLMDVSGSMTEHMKDLAKRFYVLLYIFLKRRYKNVDVVFIRHTHQAQEVDEDTFFHSPETGGTVVSTALEEMQQVIEERYSPDNWNIYAAQASDGDNTASDNDKTAALLVDVILPVCQVPTPIWKSAAIPSISRPASSAAIPICGRPTPRSAAAARRWRCARSATAATSTRCSASCSPARPHRNKRRYEEAGRQKAPPPLVRGAGGRGRT